MQLRGTGDFQLHLGGALVCLASLLGACSPTCPDEVWCEGGVAMRCEHHREHTGDHDYAAVAEDCRKSNATCDVYAPGAVACVLPEEPCDGAEVCDGNDLVTCINGVRSTLRQSCSSESTCEQIDGVAWCEPKGHCAPAQTFAAGEERHNGLRECGRDVASSADLSPGFWLYELELATPMVAGQRYGLSFYFQSLSDAAPGTLELWGGSHPTGEQSCGAMDERLHVEPLRAGVLCAEITPERDHEEVFILVYDADPRTWHFAGITRCPAGSCPEQ